MLAVNFPRCSYGTIFWCSEMHPKTEYYLVQCCYVILILLSDIGENTALQQPFHILISLMCRKCAIFQ